MYTPTNQRTKDLGLSLSDYGSPDNIKEQKQEIPSDLLLLIPLCRLFWGGSAVFIWSSLLIITEKELRTK